jgi:hypothetical protein
LHDSTVITRQWLARKLGNAAGVKKTEKKSGMAQWTSHQHNNQKTQVRIPPGYMFFGEIIAMFLGTIDLICIASVHMYVRNKGLRHKNIFEIIKNAKSWSKHQFHLKKLGSL